MSDLQYDLESIRNKMKQKKGGGSRDPNEWRADKATENTTLKWKFFILPPVDSMDLWCYGHGSHYIDNKWLECPRAHGEGDCPLCQYGFDLMSETSDKKERSAIAKAYLSSIRYAVNIFFPPISDTPAELRGKVMWFSIPKSIYQICEDVIMRDPTDDDEVEPEPYGIFFDPKNAIPFLLQAKRKGEYNTYDQSRFLLKKTPIAKSDKKIQEILDMRHDIPHVFAGRDIDQLQAIVDKLTGNSTKPAAKDEDDLIVEDDVSEDTDTTAVEDEDISEDTDAKIEDEDEDLASLLKELNSAD